MSATMKKAGCLVICAALSLSLLSSCAKAPVESTDGPQIGSQPSTSTTAATKPTTQPTKPSETTKPTTEPTTAPTSEPPETTAPPAATQPTTKPTTKPTETTKPAETTKPTTKPTEVPTQPPVTEPPVTEAPTQPPVTDPPVTEPPVTEPPTEPPTQPTLTLDYDAAMAAGNAYGVSAYGWIYDPAIGWDDGYNFALWATLEEIANHGGQEYLNFCMKDQVRSTYDSIRRSNPHLDTIICGFNCYCYESNGFVYFYVFYG